VYPIGERPQASWHAPPIFAARDLAAVVERLAKKGDGVGRHGRVPRNRSRRHRAATNSACQAVRGKAPRQPAAVPGKL